MRRRPRFATSFGSCRRLTPREPREEPPFWVCPLAPPATPLLALPCPGPSSPPELLQSSEAVPQARLPSAGRPPLLSLPLEGDEEVAAVAGGASGDVDSTSTFRTQTGEVRARRRTSFVTAPAPVCKAWGYTRVPNK